LDLAIGERTEGPILVRHDGRRLDARTAYSWVRAVGKRAGLDRIHSHTVRAAFIMAALDAGVPLRDVQIPAPHADPRTTTIYDRRRQNYDRHAAYAVVAFVTTGESPSVGVSLRRWAGAPRTAQYTVRVRRHSCTTESRRALFGANTVDGRAAGIVAVGDQPAARASVRRSHQSPSRDASPRAPPGACRGRPLVMCELSNASHGKSAVGES
jgi:hypothetical protein